MPLASRYCWIIGGCFRGYASAGAARFSQAQAHDGFSYVLRHAVTKRASCFPHCQCWCTYLLVQESQRWLDTQPSGYRTRCRHNEGILIYKQKRADGGRKQTTSIASFTASGSPHRGRIDSPASYFASTAAASSSTCTHSTVRFFALGCLASVTVQSCSPCRSRGNQAPGEHFPLLNIAGCREYQERMNLSAPLWH